ncbi:MAG: DUF177 domain-containing protein [Bacteroidales bacterium]|nr:DUF177 domain-containing protein [Bacteroidales bacterium]
MAKNNFVVDYKTMTAGRHEMKYHLDSSFFALFAESEFQNGKIDVDVSADISEYGLKFGFDIRGTVEVECDRCLGMFDLPIEGYFELKVKFGQQTSDPAEADDEIVLSHDETKLDLTHHIYEYIVLSVPARRVHPDGIDGLPMCDPDMSATLEVLEARDNVLERTTDPRWEQLRNLEFV